MAAGGVRTPETPDAMGAAAAEATGLAESLETAGAFAAAAECVAILLAKKREEGTPCDP